MRAIRLSKKQLQMGNKEIENICLPGRAVALPGVESVVNRRSAT